jgi:hypothetical protein
MVPSRRRRTSVSRSTTRGTSERLPPEAAEFQLGIKSQQAAVLEALLNRAPPESLRYCVRPPLALERLSILDDGKICYRIKDTDQVRLMTPVQFLTRLAPAATAPSTVFRHPLESSRAAPPSHPHPQSQSPASSRRRRRRVINNPCS